MEFHRELELPKSTSQHPQILRDEPQGLGILIPQGSSTPQTLCPSKDHLPTGFFPLFFGAVPSCTSLREFLPLIPRDLLPVGIPSGAPCAPLFV